MLVSAPLGVQPGFDAKNGQPVNLTRLWVLLGLLAATAWIIHDRGSVDRVPPSQPLAELPQQIGGWTSQDLPISADTLAILGKGIFLNRLYTPADPAAASGLGGDVGLFIGYFPTQRTGQSIHSPQNCLPGSGWTFDSSGTTEVRDGSGRAYRVGDYIISNGTAREEVFYWYDTQGHSIANDYQAKLYMLADSVLRHRTDAALIRITTPVARDEHQAQAHQRLLRFTEQLLPRLPAFVPE